MTTKLTKKEMQRMDKLRKDVLREGHLVTLRDIYDRAYRHFGDRLAVVEKVAGENVSYTLGQLVSNINAVGTALIDLGFKGSHIALLGENSYEWIVSFFAISCGVGVAVPLDKELDDETLGMLMNKADCDAVFFAKSYKKTVTKHMEANPDFKYGFSMYRSYKDERLIAFDDLVKKGEALLAQGDDRFTAAALDREDLAAIFFTSGTTGANKGVMLSHKNFTTNVDGIISTIPTEYTSFSLLPMNHVYELSCNIFTSTYMNAVIYINDSLKNIQKNLFEYKPDAMAAVPLVLEGFWDGIWRTAEESGRADVLRKLMQVSNALRKKGIDLRPKLFKIITGKFNDRKGMTFSCGGAPSRADYVQGMGDFGFCVYNGYGLTEAAPTVTLNLHADEDPTSAGYPFPKTAVRIADPDEDGIGEIQIKGDNVTRGYYKDEAATKASFTEDGWFMTGDYGRMTPDGELFISGRKKNLIILDNGENIFPEELEFAVQDGIHYMKEVVAFETHKTILDKREKIIAVAVWIDKAEFPDLSDSELLDKAKKDLAELNKRFARYKKIADVHISYEEFEKNSTRKIIRQKVIDRYAE